MIAVMIAAVMCAVPLFVIEDAEAYTVTADSTGVSAEASSMEPSDFAKLIPTEEIKLMVLVMVLGGMVGDLNYDVDSFTVNEVKDLKMARGTEVTEDTKTVINGTSFTLNVDFTVTKVVSSTAIEQPYDGFQDLYRAFNDMPVGHKLTFKGCTLVMDRYSKEVTKFTINNENNFVVSEGEFIESTYTRCSCDDIEYKDGDDVRELKFEYEATTDKDKCDSYSFCSADFKDEVKIKDVVDSTNTFVVSDNRDCARSTSMKYVYDGKTYDFSETKDHYDGITDTSEVTYEVSSASVAGAIIKSDIAPPVYLFCGNTQYSMFNSAEVDPSINTNDAMKTFLDDKGTIGESYSDAKSVADSTSSSVSTGGGSSNIIFYVIIGVLAVAVVALAIILIRKK